MTARAYGWDITTVQASIHRVIEMQEFHNHFVHEACLLTAACLTRSCSHTIGGAVYDVGSGGTVRLCGLSPKPNTTGRYLRLQEVASCCAWRHMLQNISAIWHLR